MVILGSTGSIGTNALKIAKDNDIKIEMLAAGSNVDLLNKQIKQFNPKIVALRDLSQKDKLAIDKNQKVYFGEDGILEAINETKSDIVINAIVGFSGLKPSLEVIKKDKILALANKESLVVGGEFIDTTNIIPLDSEHFALQELIKDKQNIKKMIITASGGALRDVDINTISTQTPQNALNHPNWNMGKKITIDSATMVNKLFEILEAKYLFHTDNIDALIERNSIIHALIQTNDNAIFAHLGYSDMKLPISYAMLGKRAKNIESIKEIDLSNFTFNLTKIDTNRYPLWNLKDTLLKNPKLGIILNAVNEILVYKFLANKIRFGDINTNIYKAIEKFEGQIKYIKNIEDVFYINKEVIDFYSFN
ncbi:1-deoxy-D-xylulose-5-phosphate reductoisomerase [Helicobacter sp. MIT 99-5507]|uniref:1-deoxy-D-xylulose-5-phosphate reductoisomerase n=1 Tax=Helicobacter sp. MIT 99-5507 TaxID=152489 RepID=UPI000E1EA6C6|nr:1-deoxy-D-xylulose-5-phosphate reductoisomerase [Helicobacter sp. MIT 99-5507]RDU58268.1 1-deoxy-D-xylulose-5-phosphate reductoisomerase [Helicobacter sp. MIT 99-5507]